MDMRTPVSPPRTKVVRNPMVQSMGVVRRTRPLYMVKSQLKTFTPVGMAMTMVEMPKKMLTLALVPMVKKWWAQTANDRNMMTAVA